MPMTIRTDFGSDSGPPCEKCRGTIYAYQVPKEGNVTVQCCGCHCYDYLPVTDIQPATASECSALHRSRRAATTPRYTYNLSHTSDGAPAGTFYATESEMRTR
jgi:hypothetical protein